MWSIFKLRLIMKWSHARKGTIRGSIIRDDDDWVDIELHAEARVADWPDPFRYGIRPLYADKGQIIRVRKSLLTLLEG